MEDGRTREVNFLGRGLKVRENTVNIGVQVVHQLKKPTNRTKEKQSTPNHKHTLRHSQSPSYPQRFFIFRRSGCKFT
jgi:hypothetical protein